MNTQKMPLKNSLCLLLAATIWGIAFVAQSVGMEYVGPFTFNGVRSLIGAAVLVPVIFLLNRSKDTASTESRRSKTFLYPVPGLRDPVHDPGSCPGTSADFFYPHCMAPHPVCRHYVLRRCLHFADRRPEKCQSNGSFSDSFPGILYLRTCRLGHPWTEAFRKRASWMRHHVRGYHPGTAAGEIFCEIGR